MAASYDAIRAWRMFPKQWTEVIHDESVLGDHQTVAVLIKVFGLWWLNSARIVTFLTIPNVNSGSHTALCRDMSNAARSDLWSSGIKQTWSGTICGPCHGLDSG